jgi:hypothetical protein
MRVIGEGLKSNSRSRCFTGDGMRIKVRDADTGDTVEMEVTPDIIVEEILQASCSNWNKEYTAYVLRFGKTQILPEQTISNCNVRDGDVLELIPDPLGGYY